MQTTELHKNAKTKFEQIAWCSLRNKQALPAFVLQLSYSNRLF